MLDCMAKTYKNEGLQGLQRGLSCSVVREASKCSFRLGLYQPILLRLHTEPGAAPLYKRLVAAGCAGGTSAVICNPVDVLKVLPPPPRAHPSHRNGTPSSLSPHPLLSIQSTLT